VCLGVLNGSEVGLKNINVIGGKHSGQNKDFDLLQVFHLLVVSNILPFHIPDNFFQDKLVIYDNDKHQIGWASANCDRLPKSSTIL
jgi:hypothetical protein